MLEEEQLVKLLAVSGLLILLFSTFYHESVLKQVGGVLPGFLIPALCEKEGGEYSAAAPTSPETCKKIFDLNKVEEKNCQHFEEAKRQACQKLVQIISERADDCISSLLLNRTSSFSEGSVEAREACRALESQ